MNWIFETYRDVYTLPFTPKVKERKIAPKPESKK